MFKKLMRKKKVKEEEGCVTLLKVESRGSFLQRPEVNTRNLLTGSGFVPEKRETQEPVQQAISTEHIRENTQELRSTYETAQPLPIIPEEQCYSIYSNVNYDYMDAPLDKDDRIVDEKNNNDSPDGKPNPQKSKGMSDSHQANKERNDDDVFTQNNEVSNEERAEAYEEVEVPTKPTANIDDEGIYSTVYETCGFGSPDISRNTSESTDTKTDYENCNDDDSIEPTYMTVNSQVIRPKPKPCEQNSKQSNTCDKPCPEHEDMYAVVSKNRTVSSSSNEITKLPLGEQESVPGPPVPGKEKLHQRDSANKLEQRDGKENKAQCNGKDMRDSSIMVDNDMYSNPTATPSTISILGKREPCLSPISDKADEVIYDEPYMKMETHAMKMTMLSLNDDYSSVLVTQESS